MGQISYKKIRLTKFPGVELSTTREFFISHNLEYRFHEPKGNIMCQIILNE